MALNCSINYTARSIKHKTDLSVVNPTASTSTSTIALTAMTSERFSLPANTNSVFPTLSASNMTESQGMTNHDDINLGIGMSIGAIALIALGIGMVIQWRKWRRER
jgi:hypothetical protein